MKEIEKASETRVEVTAFPKRVVETYARHQAENEASPEDDLEAWMALQVKHAGELVLLLNEAIGINRPDMLLTAMDTGESLDLRVRETLGDKALADKLMKGVAAVFVQLCIQLARDSQVTCGHPGHIAHHLMRLCLSTLGDVAPEAKMQMVEAALRDDTEGRAGDGSATRH